MGSNEKYDMAIGGKEDKESEAHMAKEKDAIGLANNCEYFGKFLEILKERRKIGSSDSAGEGVSLLIEQMREFMIEEDSRSDIDIKDNESKKSWDKLGVKPKRIMTNSDIQSERRRSISEVRKRGVSQSEKSSISSLSSGSESVQSEDESGHSEAERSYRYRNRHERRRSRESIRIDQMDYRKVPKLEKYKEESGQDFLKYLSKFEDYCSANFKGSRDLWLNELEEHLEGEMLENFLLVRSPDDRYRDTVNELITMYKNNAKARKERLRKRFAKAQQKEKESLYLYSVRLAGLFQTAFPRRKKNGSKTLLNKFKKSISRRDRTMLNSHLINYTMKGENATWNLVQKWVRLKDMEDDGSCESDEGAREVVISLGRYGDWKDREHQTKQNDWRDSNDQRDRNGQRDRNDRRVGDKQRYRNDQRNWNDRREEDDWNNNDRRDRDDRREQDNGRVNNHWRDRNDRRNRNDRMDRDGRRDRNDQRGMNDRKDLEIQRGKSRVRERNDPSGIDDQVCFTCNKGHYTHECRLNLGLCLVCGQDGHFVRDCPNRRELRDRSSDNTGMHAGRGQGRGARGGFYSYMRGRGALLYYQGRGIGRGMRYRSNSLGNQRQGNYQNDYPRQNSLGATGSHINSGGESQNAANGLN